MAVATRPMFRRFDDFVVVRPLRLSSAVVLQPGTQVSFRQYPTYRLRAWYRRRRIAKAGCEWAKLVLSGRFPGTVQRHDEAAEPSDQPSLEAPETEPEGDTGELRIERKRGWISVYQGDEFLTKVRGQKALAQWMVENGHGPEAV